MTVTSTRYPTRFRAAEERNRRLGRPLRIAARIGTLDEALMQRVGEKMLERDELGARLADAMRLRAGEPGRVTMADFRTALNAGVGALEAPAPALVEFFEHVGEVPEWVDWDLVAEGAKVYRRFGSNAADILTVLSLLGGYRFGGPPDLLVATGALSGDQAALRLAETQKWTVALSKPDALRPGGEAWRLTLHVRAMHALVNQRFTPEWDVERWGLPINQSDQAGTLGLFDAVVLLGVRALGVPVSRAESRAVMHGWKYIGWLMGVDEDMLVDTERERHRINYHVLMGQGDISEAGPKLARSIVDAQRDLAYGRFGRVRGWIARERLLSLMTLLLGPPSMKDFGLPLRPPWVAAYLVPLNVLRYHVLGRLPGGKERLERWGVRTSERILARHYGGHEQNLGALH